MDVFMLRHQPHRVVRIITPLEQMQRSLEPDNKRTPAHTFVFRQIDPVQRYRLICKLNNEYLIGEKSKANVSFATLLCIE